MPDIRPTSASSSQQAIAARGGVPRVDPAENNSDTPGYNGDSVNLSGAQPPQDTAFTSGAYGTQYNASTGDRTQTVGIGNNEAIDPTSGQIYEDLGGGQSLNLTTGQTSQTNF